ncbi:MAG: hypothetical protein CVV23_05490 [Ignavibacteriae bacterium HGW-Ignavibacteriae-2]|jgi:predicted phosphodiesterase|nr:MAG: hypothetical protein CVV23_05490 [Ignavibacteriae bacterium HGW-Ignavibacteriae-2]
MKIGFISDIHEDVYSLQQALRILSSENCDSVICLGDIVGFTLPFYRYIETRNAEECIRLIRENCSVVVAGNHDLYAVKKVPENKAGFPYGDDWYSQDYEVRAKKARNRIWLYEDNEIKSTLSDSTKEYLSGLKETEFAQFENVKLLFSHFCCPDFSGSAIYFPSQTFHLQKHFEFMKEHDCTLSFSGHGHPEGVIFVDNDNFKNLDFGTFDIHENLPWISIPCVARTTRSNGVLVFDTTLNRISAIPLLGNSFQ